MLQLSEDAIKAYSQLTLADCARIDCALMVRTVNYLHNAALHAPGGVPEEFDAIHAAYQAVPKYEKDVAFKQGKEEAIARNAKIEAAQKKKEARGTVFEPKKLADALTVKDAEKIQYAFVMHRIGIGRQHFSAEEADQRVRQEWTKSGSLNMNPVDREVGGSNTERWKQTAASARQNLKNEGYIMWSARAQRWIIPLTEQDLKKEAKKRVENAPVRILELKRTS